MLSLLVEDPVREDQLYARWAATKNFFVCVIKRKSLPAGLFLVGLGELPERAQLENLFQRSKRLESVRGKTLGQLSNVMPVKVSRLLQGRRELGPLEKGGRSWRDCLPGSPCRESWE